MVNYLRFGTWQKKKTKLQLQGVINVNDYVVASSLVNKYLYIC